MEDFVQIEIEVLVEALGFWVYDGIGHWLFMNDGIFNEIPTSKSSTKLDIKIIVNY